MLSSNHKLQNHNIDKNKQVGLLEGYVTIGASKHSEVLQKTVYLLWINV